MVWFQCEDCGENLKKPKLPNHFRSCSATKLSCIDCGEMFSQQSVQGHTQCITEAEKYGPKGQGKASNGTPGKQINKDSKQQQQPDFDIKVGLSNRPPWFCSLCNTKATSEQTLLLHADGKKHRAKARAFHVSKQPPQQKEEAAPQAMAPSESAAPVSISIMDEPKEPHSGAGGGVVDKSGADKGTSPGNNKRKRDNCGNGEVIQANRLDDKGKKIKWKKLIKSALKSNPDRPMKMKKLQKHVFGAAKEMGIEDDNETLKETLQRKIESCSRFTVEGKYVRLAKKD